MSSFSDPEPDLPDDEETLRATLRELQAQVEAANADDDGNDNSDIDGIIGGEDNDDEDEAPIVHEMDSEPAAEAVAKDASEMDEGDIEEDDPATLALLQQLGAQLQAQADAEEAAERDAEEAAEALEEAMELSQEDQATGSSNGATTALESQVPTAPDAPMDLLESGGFDSNMLAYAQQVLEHAEAVSRMGSRAPSPVLEGRVELPTPPTATTTTSAAAASEAPAPVSASPIVAEVAPIATEETPMDLDESQDGGDTQHEELLRKLLADLQAQVAEDENEQASLEAQEEVVVEDRSRDVEEDEAAVDDGPAAKRRRLDPTTTTSPKRSPIPPSIEAALASQAEAQARAASASSTAAVTAQKSLSPVLPAPTARAISVNSSGGASPARPTSVVSPAATRALAAAPSPLRASASPRPAAVAAAALAPSPRPRPAAAATQAQATASRPPLPVAAARRPVVRSFVTPAAPSLPTVPKPLKSTYQPMSAEERAAALAPLRQTPIDLDHFAPDSLRRPASTRSRIRIRSKPRSSRSQVDKATEMARAQKIVETVTILDSDDEAVVSALATILPHEDIDEDSSDEDDLSDSNSDGGGRSPSVNLLTTPGPGMYRAKRQRNRLTLSCTECHRRKQQCDRKDPCTRCVKRGIPGLCHMEKEPLPLFRRKKLDDAGQPSKHHAIALKLRAIESIVRTEASRQRAKAKKAEKRATETAPAADGGEAPAANSAGRAGQRSPLPGDLAQPSTGEVDEQAASKSPTAAVDGDAQSVDKQPEDASRESPAVAVDGKDRSQGKDREEAASTSPTEPVDGGAELTDTALAEQPAAPPPEQSSPSDDDMDIDSPEETAPIVKQEEGSVVGNSANDADQANAADTDMPTETDRSAQVAEVGQVQPSEQSPVVDESHPEQPDDAEHAATQELDVDDDDDEADANLQAALAALLAAQAEDAEGDNNDVDAPGVDDAENDAQSLQQPEPTQIAREDDSDADSESTSDSEAEAIDEHRQEALNTIGDLAYTLMQTRGAADDVEEEADGGIAAIGEVSLTIQEVVNEMPPGASKTAAMALLKDVLAAAPPPLPQYEPAATMWKQVPFVPPTSYASANSAYLEDKQTIKLNLSLVGFREDNGRIFVPPTTRRIERQLYVKNGFSHEPLPVRGYGPFLEGGLRFAYGVQGKAWKDRRIAAVQAISTIGALRIGGTFLSRFPAVPDSRVVHYPEPSRQEDLDVFRDLGYTVKPYCCLNRSPGGGLDWQGMQADLSSAERGAVVILHVGGNIPSGIDLTPEQWKATVELVKSRQLVPLFVMECQGLGSGDAEKDADPIRAMAHEGLPVILAQSFASSMGLYAENPSILSIICHDLEDKTRIESQLVAISRTIHAHTQPWAAKIAATILADPAVYRTWLNETKAMSDRLRTIREKLFDQLQNRLKVPGDWQYIRASRGMFCTLLLTTEQLGLLRSRERMHLYPGGHVSLGCLNAAKIERLALAVNHVVREPDAVEPVKYVPRPPPVAVAPSRPLSVPGASAAGLTGAPRATPAAGPAPLRPTTAQLSPQAVASTTATASRSPQTVRPRPAQPTAQGRPIPPRPPHIQVTVRTLDAAQRSAPKPPPTPGRPPAAAAAATTQKSTPTLAPSAARSPAPAPAAPRPPPAASRPPPTGPRSASNVTTTTTTTTTSTAPLTSTPRQPPSSTATGAPAPTPRPPLPAQPKPTGPMPPRPPGGVAGRPPTGPLGGRPGALAARSPVSIPSLPAGALARLAGPPVRPVDPPVPRPGSRPAGYANNNNNNNNNMPSGVNHRSVSQPTMMMGRQMMNTTTTTVGGGASSGVIIPASSGSPAMMLPLPPPQMSLPHPPHHHVKREDASLSSSSSSMPSTPVNVGNHHNASASAAAAAAAEDEMNMDEDEMLRQMQAELERALQQTIGEASRTIAAS